MELQVGWHRWDVTPKEAVEIQRELRSKVVLQPPPGLKVERIAGADVSTEKGRDTGYGGIVVLDAGSLTPVAQAGSAVPLRFPYVPGLLSFRELPVVAEAWARLEVRPDVLIFDGHGIAHPRRLGIACHGGLLLGVPSIGCAKSLLVGKHGRLGAARGSTSPILHKDEVVGMAVRTRKSVQPVYVSPGHLMDLPTAVEWVLRASPKYREPETTRHAHRMVNALRRADGEAAELE
ncbi:endonuclease V [Myxococcus stipitatus DSM 14675]|uniref:Endonuclease V n=1 Tax=Myxococcus stipitatus (strain DSM 14675 / JCM 12634 / Mx s8) TaxID=1278073 RepID=L7U951_MYXSD|nr:deoxyribonuclease V [Myxococcus stipitatus]AGC42964.1 endonuclease V [Myxococcus stipitatus DSM 14675]